MGAALTCVQSGAQGANVSGTSREQMQEARTERIRRAVKDWAAQLIDLT